MTTYLVAGRPVDASYLQDAAVGAEVDLDPDTLETKQLLASGAITEAAHGTESERDAKHEPRTRSAGRAHGGH